MLFLPIILLSLTNYVIAQTTSQSAAPTIAQTAPAPTETDSTGFNSATCEDFDGVSSCLESQASTTCVGAADVSALQCACSGAVILMNCWSTYCPQGTSAADMLFLSSESSGFCDQTDLAGATATGAASVTKGTTASVTKGVSSSASATGAVATTTSKGAAEGAFGTAPVVGGVLAGLMGLVAWLL